MSSNRYPRRHLVLEPLESRTLLAVVPVPSFQAPTIQARIDAAFSNDTILVREQTSSGNVPTSVPASAAQSTVIRIPEDFSTIQDGINAARAGDTVLVAEGTYLENLTISKPQITVQGAGRGLTIIDGDGAAPVLRITNVDSSVLVTGFTITGGLGSDEWRGGGIDIRDASPIIYDNQITENRAHKAGGGIHVTGLESDPLIINNEISNNDARIGGDGFGGGLYLGNSRGTVAHNKIIGNEAWHSGAVTIGGPTWVYGNLIAHNWADYNPGIVISGACGATIEGNVIWDNFADYQSGAGIYVSDSGPHRIINNTVVGTQGGPGWIGSGIIAGPNTEVRNNIVAFNERVGIAAEEETVLEYNLVYGHDTDYSGAPPGEGSISEPPLFVDLANGDFHLQPDSPGIDVGDPRAEFNDPDGNRNDMGAYGGPVFVVLVDRDRDGLGDDDEVAHGTNPLDPDTDGDRVLDGEEVWVYSTDALSADTDQDQVDDGLELELDFDPLDPASTPVFFAAMDLATLGEKAFELTRTPFLRPEPQLVAALDPPPGGGRDCVGLTYQEYLGIETTNVLDQDLSYLRPEVRGGANKIPLQLWVDEDQDGVYQRKTYEDANPDYSSSEIRPPINPALIPIAGQAISGVAVGHEQPGHGFPQFLDVVAEGYARFNGHSPMLVGSSTRLVGAHNVFSPDEDFPIIRELYVTTTDTETANLLALVDSEGFTGAVSMDLVPGPETEIRVDAIWFPRRDIFVASEPETGVLGYSSQFWKDERDTSDDDTDEAHDVDTLVVVLDTTGDGRADKIVERGINNPDEVGQILVTDFSPPPGGRVHAFALENRDRNPQHYSTYAEAAYSSRASYGVEWVASDIPLGLHLYEQYTDREHNDNVVFLATIQQDLHQAETFEDGIHVEYVTKAFFPDQVDTALGEIELLEISLQDVAVDGAGYAFTPAYTGRVTVEAFFSHAAGNVDLALYGPGGQLIAESATDTDNEQLEAPVEAAQTYRLVLNGDNPEVTVQLANLQVVDDDPPTAINNTGSMVTQGMTDPIGRVELAYTDSEQPDDGITYTVISGPSHGRLELTNDPGTAITNFTQADVDTDLLVYIHDGSAPTTDGFQFKVDDGLGNTLAGQSFVIIVSVDLGPIDFLPLDGVDPSLADRWYRLEATRRGYLTVEALFAGPSDSVRLTLYDQDRSDPPLAVSTLVDGNPRTDWQAGGAGETYYLRLSGSDTGVDIRLVNLLDHRGTTVTVHGTESDDTFEFKAAASRDVTINGVRYHFDEAQVESVTFDGGDGHDVVILDDSIGDDALTAEAKHAVFSNSDQTPGFTVTMDGFEELRAYSKAGGNDSAVLHGSATHDKLKSYEDIVRLRAKNMDYSLRVKFFDSVVGDAGSGGKNTAVFNSSNGTNSFRYDGSSNTTQMQSTERNHKAVGFDRIIARAGDGSDDVAYFTDMPGDDRDVFYFKTHKTELVGSAVKVTARAFDEVHAEAGQGGFNVARIYDTAADEHFEFIGDTARVYRRIGTELDLLYEAIAFDRVKAYRSTGNDTKDDANHAFGDELYLYGW